MYLQGVPEEKNREAGGEEISKEKTAENTSELKKKAHAVVLSKILKLSKDKGIISEVMTARLLISHGTISYQPWDNGTISLKC